MSSSRHLLIAGAAALALVGCQKDAKPAASKLASTDVETVAQPTLSAAARAPQAAEAAATVHAAADEGYNCGDKEQQEKLGCAGMDEEEGGGCNQWDGEASEVTKRDVPGNAVWTSYDVDGMTCGGCERRIIANVGRLEGVVAVEASAELGKVRVAIAPDAKVTADDAKARIAELGYRIQ